MKKIFILVGLALLNWKLLMVHRLLNVNFYSYNFNDAIHFFSLRPMFAVAKARRVFPSFDEPSFKSSFQVLILMIIVKQ